MTETPRPRAQRHDQMFPILNESEIARVARFGERRRYAAGVALFRTGDVGIGLLVLVSGRVAIARHDATGRAVPVADHEPGSIIGETAGLSGKPALVDGVAVEDCEAIVLAPSDLRALLVADDAGNTVWRVAATGATKPAEPNGTDQMPPNAPFSTVAPTAADGTGTTGRSATPGTSPEGVAPAGDPAAASTPEAPVDPGNGTLAPPSTTPPQTDVPATGPEGAVQDAPAPPTTAQP